ncbi:MAG: glycogen debranching protein [Chloroflexi bacterium CSP1-4]|nr:MAG: glycogen debranching protein [Chloroflexi bacterium CSP1-4]
MATSLKGAATATIALKEGPYVAVSAEDGSMTPPDAGFGLYVHDVRFLSAFEVRVAGVAPLLLSASDRETYVATMQLVNPPLRLPDGRTVAQQALSIRRARFIDGGLRERIGLLNSGPATVPLELSIELDADFGDMFAVRGYRPSPPAAVTVERVAGGLLLSATGADGVLRQTRVTTDPAPDAVTDRTLRFGAKLAPQERFVIEVTVVPTEDGHRPEPGSERPFDAAIELLRDRYAAFLAAGTRIETGDGRLDDLLRRSALDLRALVDHTPSGPMLTAGIPWYAVPFGRDALITGLETLDFQPELALGALRFLAAHQGQRVDPFTEEEPGRIFHELRRGELARMGAVPHRPYFGTVDATPLFVRLFVETVRWLGDRRIYDELLPHALAALEWCDTHGDPDGDGFVEHSSLPGSPLRNKGWKDSATSLCYRDGSPVELPAALVEVQAYVYAAKDGLAQLSAELGDGALAERLAAEAAALRERFEAAFWLPAERCYAQALDAGKRPVDAVTSNAGHCLWAGIAAPEHATLLVERLLEPDMFTGWGIRTLSSSYPTYSPMSYHNGSVWPHDNALIAAGMAAYGHREAAARVITAVLEAAGHFADHRLPELFCGFARDHRYASRPAEYLVSCSPQAWSAGAPFLLLQTALGLRPAEFGQPPVIDPVLPEGIDRLAFRGLLAAGRRRTFAARRTARGVRVTGDLSVRRLGPAGQA